MPARINWFLINQQKAIFYSEKIKEWKSIKQLKDKIEQDILSEEKINNNSETMKSLKIKLEIINEIL